MVLPRVRGVLQLPAEQASAARMLCLDIDCATLSWFGCLAHRLLAVACCRSCC